MSIARLMQQAAAGSAGTGPAPSGWTDPDLGNASYDSVSFSVAGQEDNIRSLRFKPDGTKMYVVGASGDDVNEYDLSTAWDVSTATYLQNFSVASQDLNPHSLSFKPDGTKMYVIGASGDRVNEYNLSTAWDISTASFVQFFSIAPQDGSPYGLFFRPDGLKMYFVGLNGRDINEYNVSTAWDISTASFVQSFSVSAQSTVPLDVVFNPDGTKMYMAAIAGVVYEYILTTAWDVSTASYASISFSFASQDSSTYSIQFKSDGSKMYVLGNATDTIYQYSTA